MDEIYKDIEGYEGLYQISNLGNVKSLVDNNGVAREKILKPAISNGYKIVMLYRNKTRKTYTVHRLVAQAFLENPNNLPMINHKDECKTNNVVTNIEWCNAKYNSNYGTRNERIANNTNRSKAISKSMTNNKKISKSVCAFKDGKLVMTFPSTNEARRNGFSQGAISDCCRNCFNRPSNNVYKGYTWRYL